MVFPYARRPPGEGVEIRLGHERVLPLVRDPPSPRPRLQICPPYAIVAVVPQLSLKSFYNSHNQSQKGISALLASSVASIRRSIRFGGTSATHNDQSSE